MIIRAELDRLSTIDFQTVEKPSHYLVTLLYIAFYHGFEEVYQYVGSEHPEQEFLPANMRLADGGEYVRCFYLVH